MKLKQSKLKTRRTAALSGMVTPLMALAIVAMSGSVTPALANIPVASNIDINTANWSTSAGFGSTALGWYKETGLVDPDVVHLQGAVKQTSASGTNANLIGTLPPAASPSRVVYAVVHTFNGTYADVSISPNGQIWLINPRPPAVKDYSFVSLESITYEQVLPVWDPINLTAFWSPNTVYGSGVPGWYMDGSFDVHVQGGIAQTSSAASNTLGTIVDGGAPTNRVIYTIVHTFNGTYADVGISPNGQIGLIDPRPPMVKDYTFVSLENITYGDNALNSITPNSANWSFTPGFGAIAPGWYKDAVGIVHLVGAAKQINAGGTNPNLLGTLSAAASPKRTVYTIVHTFNGTYADLAISPNGQITLINPRAPAVKDFSFVSLESITFQQ
ncbi:MAG: hypothetical protein JOZ08_06925 [Verrucomicrobia bacterium]|nr:hypothetical protein [Verrucomicrobiota bacterium]